MRDEYGKFEERGASLVAIGMGRVDEAASFREEQKIPFPLLVDRTKRTYRAMGLARGNLLSVAGPRVWARGIRSLASGNRQKIPRQDPYQLGGAAVISEGGKIEFIHRSARSSENVPVDTLLEAL